MPPAPQRSSPGDGRTPSRSDASDAQRSRIVLIALAVLAAFIAGSALIAAVIDGDGPSEPTVTVEGEEAGAPPEIVPKPNSGDAPEEPGDRGGWAQLAVLGAIVLTVSGIGLVVVREFNRYFERNYDVWNVNLSLSATWRPRGRR